MRLAAPVASSFSFILKKLTNVGRNRLALHIKTMAAMVDDKPGRSAQSGTAWVKQRPPCHAATEREGGVLMEVEL